MGDLTQAHGTCAKHGIDDNLSSVDSAALERATTARRWCISSNHGTSPPSSEKPGHKLEGCQALQTRRRLHFIRVLIVVTKKPRLSRDESRAP